LKVGSGRELGLVATHLQPNAAGAIPVSEAERAAAVATALVAKNRSVVLAGDLNAEPGRGQLAAVSPALVGAPAPEPTPPTTPSYPLPLTTRHPVQVLIPPDPAPTDSHVPASTNSDHRPVAVSLAPR